MAGSSESYHEPLDVLSSETKDLHRALSSVQEELEAVDWYRQRADACADDELREILLHNMREEMEHACMVLEWLRRRNADFAGYMETYLFTKQPVLEVEEEDTGESERPTREDAAARSEDPAGPGSAFTIGSLKRERS